MSRLLIKNAKALLGIHAQDVRLLAGAGMADLPQITDAWLTAKNGRITGFGPMAEWPGITDWNDLVVVDASGRYVLPGWCDPHTHTVFAATREEEFVDKIRGLSYQDIAARGGGILNSARKLRDMPEDDLYVQAEARLAELMRLGTVAVEIKSGYGLSAESELKMLRVAKRLKDNLPLQVKATLLAAHALPPEYKDKREAYVDLIVQDLIPRVAEEGLAQFVDVFCEANYFTVAEMERILDAGLAHGLRGKVHVNQFTSLGGIAAAAQYGALSVDHLEVMDPADFDTLIQGTQSPSKGALGPIPTLLPGCSHFLGIPYGPARALIQRGLPLALASDFNPGSAPSGNMNMVLSLACIKLRLLPEEAINACTLNAAAAMDLVDELGSIAVGKRASLLITREIPSPALLPYSFGNDLIDTVLIDGAPFRTGEALA
ncbi:MAG: imidazolonepropionase [Flavobacteriales bacterium]|nr:imidazolonepropionase [Flavobacteriales bacterium]